MPKQVYEVKPSKFALLDEPEMAVRIAETMLDLERPEGKTPLEVLEDLKKRSPDFAQVALRVARTCMLYVREVVVNAQDIKPEAKVQ